MLARVELSLSPRIWRFFEVPMNSNLFVFRGRILLLQPLKSSKYFLNFNNIFFWSHVRAVLKRQIRNSQGETMEEFLLVGHWLPAMITVNMDGAHGHLRQARKERSYSGPPRSETQLFLKGTSKNRHMRGDRLSSSLAST